MSIPLHLLVLEDNPSDAELMIHELRRAGFEPDWKRVETEADFLAALDPGLDLILADYNLPQFDGLRALNLVQERKLGIPLLIVSGTIGDEMAVEVMKKGAADYLLKDRLARLGPAVKQVLERKQAEEKLNASENELRALFAAITDVVIVLDGEGRYLSIAPTNPAYLYRMPQEMLGKTIHEVLPKESADYMLGKIKEAIQTKQAVPGEYALPIDGKEIWFASSTSRLSDNSVIWVAHDISAHKQAEELLRESTERLNEAQKLAHIGVWVWKPDTDIVTWTEELYRIAGLNPMLPAPTYKEQSKIYTSESYELLKTGVEKAMETGESYQFELELIRPNGDIRYVNAFGGANFDSKGQVIGLLGTVQDITEHKQAEDALRGSEFRFRTLIEQAPVAILITRKGFGLFTNQKALKTYGLSSNEDFVSRPIAELFAPEFQEESRERTRRRALGLPVPIGYESMGLRMDGSQFPIQVVVAPIQLSDGLANMAFVTDITERKKAEEKLKEYSEHLQEMVEERTRQLREAQEQLVRKEKLAVLGQLAGGVGHELRNPLGVISNSVYYLKMVQPDADEKIKKHLGMIEQELHNATRIVGDLLDYAREISTEPQTGSVRELVEQTLSRFPAPDSIHVSVKIPADLPQVYADPLHVEQILGNLITNAWQAMFTPSFHTKADSGTLSGGGKLTIRAHRKKNLVAIAVKDTGTGITAENMRKLFEPLFSTKINGIGLGLAVSKKLAEANGGGIEVESEEGKGSKFTLYLPIGSEPE